MIRGVDNFLKALASGLDLLEFNWLCQKSTWIGRVERDREREKTFH
jgi:hypothetical protein